jgi:hypothetical protein
LEFSASEELEHSVLGNDVTLIDNPAIDYFKDLNFHFAIEVGMLEEFQEQINV